MKLDKTQKCAVDKLRRLKQAAKRIAENIETVNAILKEQLPNGSFEFGERKVLSIAEQTSGRFDKAQYLADFPNRANEVQAYTNETTSRVLRLH
jgi:hypothetical protein